MNETFRKIGFSPADILLPKDIDMTKWAVVACDQFTSQPEYWQAVENTVGDAPSALRLILPEAGLNSPDVETRITQINRTMEQYLSDNLFETLPDTLVYIERVQSDGEIRHGLVGKIDLEAYDFTPGSGALIRATEGTVLSRIPPRVRVRQNAPLEISHVMLLIDDPSDTVLAPLRNGADMDKLYQFELQQGGGSITGWKLSDAQTDSVSNALTALCTPEEQTRKYGISDEKPLLFAVGDGNHSLATAKQCYEDLKKITPPEQWETLPARYALVEIVNLHDAALKFEAIHRCVSGVNPEAVLKAFHDAFPNAFSGTGNGHSIEFIWAGHDEIFTIPDPKAQLAAGTLQTFLDAYLEHNPGEIDYIHGESVVRNLAERPDSMGFLLPAIGKEQLFKTVIKDGVLPRKTFSMGHAQDKRYYVEARKIR